MWETRRTASIGNGVIGSARSFEDLSTAKTLTISRHMHDGQGYQTWQWSIITILLSHGFPTVASWYAQVPGFKMGKADAVSQN